MSLPLYESIFTWRFSQMNLHDCDHRRVQIVCLRLFCVQNLHRVRTTGDREDGRLEEILRELDGVQSS